MFYDTKVICTYHTDEIFLEEEQNLIERDKIFIREAIYRQELSNILGLDQNEDPERCEEAHSLVNRIHDLYMRIKDCDVIMHCMSNMAGQFMSTDAEFGLIILFAYDYLPITHKCVSQYLDNGVVSSEDLRNLQKAVNDVHLT